MPITTATDSNHVELLGDSGSQDWGRVQCGDAFLVIPIAKHLVLSAHGPDIGWGFSLSTTTSVSPPRISKSVEADTVSSSSSTESTQASATPSARPEGCLSWKALARLTRRAVCHSGELAYSYLLPGYSAAASGTCSRRTNSETWASSSLP